MECSRKFLSDIFPYGLLFVAVISKIRNVVGSNFLKCKSKDMILIVIEASSVLDWENNLLKKF